MEFMSLPPVMIENVFSYLLFDEIAKCRQVSKTCDEICSQLLNRGFIHIERRHNAALKQVKTQLPRRESERRNHQLAKHCDILTSIETRISMLNMTYAKYIDHQLCCFIPGKVIDEIGRVLTLLEIDKSPQRTHEVLQELRDISSMAIEHFDDKIAPPFRKQLQQARTPTNPPPCPESMGPSISKHEMNRVRRRVNINSRRTSYIADQLAKLHKAVTAHKRVILNQQWIIKQMARRQKEQDSTIADLKKRIDECDIKYSELTHTNVGGKSMSGTDLVAENRRESSSQSLCHFSSQIKLDLSVLPIGTSKRSSKTLLPNMKPRKPMIKLPSLSESEDEPPKKVPKVETEKSDLKMINAVNKGIKYYQYIKMNRKRHS